MDVISTKTEATALLRSGLDDHREVLSTHPLFGPPSMDRMRPGQKLVVTACEGDRAEAFLAFLEESFGLEPVRIAPEEHDEAMAYIQALPFFIARALVRLKILDRTERELGLPSFEKLATIAEIELHHTPAMFDTSQRSNPYAARVRKEFLDVLTELDRELDSSTRRGSRASRLTASRGGRHDALEGRTRAQPAVVAVSRRATGREPG